MLAKQNEIPKEGGLKHGTMRKPIQSADSDI
jgi:hypothetical protein